MLQPGIATKYTCLYHLTSLQIFIVIPHFCLCIPSHCLHSVVSSRLCFISLPASDFCSYFTDDGCCIASETFDSVVNFCFLASVIVIVSLCVLLATQAFWQVYSSLVGQNSQYGILCISWCRTKVFWTDHCAS